MMDNEYNYYVDWCQLSSHEDMECGHYDEGCKIFKCENEARSLYDEYKNKGSYSVTLYKQVYEQICSHIAICTHDY
jgi:hypothetical protein